MPTNEYNHLSVLISFHSERLFISIIVFRQPLVLSVYLRSRAGSNPQSEKNPSLPQDRTQHLGFTDRLGHYNNYLGHVVPR